MGPLSFCGPQASALRPLTPSPFLRKPRFSWSRRLRAVAIRRRKAGVQGMQPRTPRKEEGARSSRPLWDPPGAARASGSCDSRATGQGLGRVRRPAAPRGPAAKAPPAELPGPAAAGHLLCRPWGARAGNPPHPTASQPRASVPFPAAAEPGEELGPAAPNFQPFRAIPTVH